MSCSDCAYCVVIAPDCWDCHRRAPVSSGEGDAWWPRMKEVDFKRGCGEHSGLDSFRIWVCGCGTVNGVNLATCRVCNRSAGATS